MEGLVGAYLFNTAGSVLEVVSTGYLHARTGNPDENNGTIKHVMNERGPLVGGLITEKNRRIGYALISLGLIAIDKFIAPTFFGVEPHLTELALCGTGLVYFGAAFLNFSSTLGVPTQRKK